MKTKLELLGRSLLIYFTTILTGTFFSAIYMTAIDFDRSGDFAAYFLFGNIITGFLSIPTILILFIGFFLIYKKCKDNTQKWQYIILVSFLTCYTPIAISIALLLNPSPHSNDVQLLFASIPYVFTSFISIFSLTYYFDKKKPPLFRQEKETANDDILDAPF